MRGSQNNYWEKPSSAEDPFVILSEERSDELKDPYLREYVLRFSGSSAALDWHLAPPRMTFVVGDPER